MILAVLPGAAFGFCTEVAYHVNTTADETTPSDGLVSLREAVAAANADPTPNACHEIFLPPGHYTLLPAQGGTLQLTAAPIVVIAPEAPIISSHEVVIDGGDAVSLFHVAPGIDAQFNSLTLTHGLRAIVNDGQATLSRLTVVDNHVTGASGGAVLNNVGQQMYVYDSTFVGNRVVRVQRLRRRVREPGRPGLHDDHARRQQRQRHHCEGRRDPQQRDPDRRAFHARQERGEHPVGERRRPRRLQRERQDGGHAGRDLRLGLQCSLTPVGAEGLERRAATRRAWQRG